MICAVLLSGAKVEKGFTSIFNGKDLSGWEGMSEMWTVVDGAITPKQSTLNNWVFWRGGQPADFELRLSFRYHSGNSGVQVRTIEFEPFQARGYQVEVAPQDKMGLWHHSKLPEKYSRGMDRFPGSRKGHLGRIQERSYSD